MQQLDESNPRTPSSSSLPSSLSTSKVASWEKDVANKIKSMLINDSNRAEARTEQSGPLIIGIVGIPGSGKTTCSQILSDVLQEMRISTMIMPMDGYHYPLSTLKSFDDANTNTDDTTGMVYRRGAPDTFDSQSLLADLSAIKRGIETFVPDFDHSLGDPILNAFKYDPAKAAVVICEGLYLLLENGHDNDDDDDDGWKGIGDLLDFTIFIHANVDVCVQRLKIRNLCIPGYSKEEIELRCDAVDRVNAMTVLRSKSRADLIVDSVI